MANHKLLIVVARIATNVTTTKHARGTRKKAYVFVEAEKLVREARQKIHEQYSVEPATRIAAKLPMDVDGMKIGRNVFDNKEKAARAAEEGEPEVAQFWQEEAEFYGSLRADVTQDEGSYSRFLDTDEWYERERRKTAARVDRSKFGNLLDGIE